MIFLFLILKPLIVIEQKDVRVSSLEMLRHPHSCFIYFAVLHKCLRNSKILILTMLHFLIFSCYILQCDLANFPFLFPDNR